LERRASGQHVELAVPGGTDWDAFVLLACEGELSGVECLAGIPGLTGGSPVQNIGAYGQEVADTILHVRAFDLETDRFVQLSNADCGFSYRSSVFNSSARGRYIITAVTFRFDPGARPRLTYADLTRHFAGREPSPMEVYHAVREIRRAKGMLLVPGDPDCRSAGSFFKNPVVPTAELDHIAGELGLAAEAVPHWPAPSLDNGSHAKLAAAWLLERAGFTKGFTLGNAGISSRHTLALINRGGASYADLVALRERIRSEVHARFGIMLEQEPVELGA
jgi:UDP-N-acetylmuramate dehydrogenase